MNKRKGNAQKSKQVSRRSFMKIAGAAGAAAGLVRWTSPLVAQTGSGAAAASVAPVFPPLHVGAITLADFLAYDPSKDPSAKYFRSHVPLAPRIAPYAATQANPALSPKPQVANFSWFYNPLDSDYFNDGTGATNYGNLLPYGPTDNVFISRFLQYQDITSYWQLSCSIPNPALTDAAHRNGTLCIGNMFTNAPNSGFQTDQFLQQDAHGGFPVANQLVDIAFYFGFDGYMFDMENDNVTDPAALKLVFQFIPAMRARAKQKGMQNLYMQVYGYNYDWETLDEQTVGWFNANGANSIYLDYGFDLPTSLQTAANHKLDPFKTIFCGLELETRGDLLFSPQDGISRVIPANGSAAPLASLAIFDPEIQTMRIAAQAATAANNGVQPPLAQLQPIIYAAERQFWSGASSNPAVPSTDQTATYGIADYITERSVIGSFPFITRFNTGSGSHFFNEGTIVGQNPWFNMGAQDILPTWQWWTKDFNSSAVPAGLLTADYDFTTAYNGGSSLKVSGKLGPKNPTELRLFKTRLVVPSGGDPYVSLRYKAGQSGATNLYVGLIFEDNASAPVWTGVDAGFNIGAKTNGWIQAKLPLGNYAGRTIAAISLGFKVGAAVTAASSYAINIGEVALSDATSDAVTMAVPAGFAIEKSLIVDETSAQLRLTWNFDPAVWYYDIYRQPLPNGNETLATLGDTTRMMWLGRITADCYYVSSLPRLSTASQTELITGIQLVAVSPAGKETVSYYRGCIPFSWTTNRGTAGFSLTTSVPSPSFATGTSTTVPITITELNGFNSPVTLKATGLPAGMTAKFSPNPATGTSAVLTLAASKTVVAGTYTVTVTGTSGSLASTVTLSVSVGSPGFSLSDSQGGSLYLPSGSTGTDVITVTPVYGFNSSVALSVSGLPPGMTASFSPASTKGSSTLTLALIGSAPEQSTQLTITGTSGSLSQTLSLYIY